MPDYLHMSQLLVSIVVQGMMQFTQAVATQASSGGTTGTTNPLNSIKGFDRDQIARFKDVCGIMSARDIPNIWYFIQTTKEKVYDADCDHLKKLISEWCMMSHIERDKLSIYLTSSLITQRHYELILGAWWPSTIRRVRGISMLAC